MTDVSRRQFHQAGLGSLLTFSVLEFLFSRDAFAQDVKPITARWLADLDSLGRDLKGQKLSQVDWQNKVEGLLGQVQLEELLQFIDFEKLRQQEIKDQGETSTRLRFPEVDGLPTQLVFGHQMFALKKGRSVAPHGHDNMATAFLILDGEFRGRHYDRVEDVGKESMIVKPTIDRSFGRGDYSTVTDEKDNVHWFTASSDTGFIFNIHIMSVRPGRTGRVYMDPQGESLAGGLMKCRRISADEAYRLYG